MRVAANPSDERDLPVSGRVNHEAKRSTQRRQVCDVCDGDFHGGTLGAGRIDATGPFVLAGRTRTQGGPAAQTGLSYRSFTVSGRQ